VPLNIQFPLLIGKWQHLFPLTTAIADSNPDPSMPLSEYQQHDVPPDMFPHPPAPLRLTASDPLIPERQSSKL
jgi:hypothetical protein